MLLLCSLLLTVLCLLRRTTAVCLYGTAEGNPAKTCREILMKNADCYQQSGTFWLDCGSGGPAKEVFCDMSRLGGGWVRLVEKDFTSGGGCPPGSGWTGVQIDGVDYCSTVDGVGAAPWTLSAPCPFSEVAGYVLADQRGKSEGFYTSHRENPTLDTNYVDGVSITYGNATSTSPRQHVFTYAAGREELPRVESCPCHGSPYSDLPYFVQWDFLCDSSYAPFTSSPTSVGYRTLWSGEGCGAGSGCCHDAGAPWFHKRLPDVVADQPIELRIMTDSTHADEMILVKQVALYVR